MLKTYQPSYGPKAVYVTDYTTNELLPAVDGAWCDPSLAQRILKVEFWDRAAEYAEKMQGGEYYALRNVRMKVSHGGYVEAKMVEGNGKIRKLDADELEEEPFLVNLLR